MMFNLEFFFDKHSQLFFGLHENYIAMIRRGTHKQANRMSLPFVHQLDITLDQPMHISETPHGNSVHKRLHLDLYAFSEVAQFISRERDWSKNNKGYAKALGELFPGCLWFSAACLATVRLARGLENDAYGEDHMFITEGYRDHAAAWDAVRAAYNVPPFQP